MRRAPRLLAILIAGAAAAGCASPKTYPGPERPLRGIAVVVAGRETEFRTRYVRIRRISGELCPGGECRWTTPFVHLLPGRYEFEVQYGSQAPIVDLLPVDVMLDLGDAAVAARNRRLRDTITFAVEANRTYGIHFDPQGERYFVHARVSTTPKPAQPGLTPPPGASPCSPAPSDQERIRCTSLH